MSPNPSKRMVHRKSASPRFFALVKNILMPDSFRVFRRELSCKPPQLVEVPGRRIDSRSSSHRRAAFGRLSKAAGIGICPS